ncbi:SBBP repeat-containing protein [Planctomycetaceae bacterium SH139]
MKIVVSVLAVGFCIFVATPIYGQSAWVSYLAGAEARDVAVDSDGNIYVAGGTAITSGFATDGAYDTSFNGGTADVSVSAFRKDGSLIFATYIGGPKHDRAYAIEVDETGIYVAGRAGDGMPVSANAFQKKFAGDADVNDLYGAQDGFVAKLSLDGKSLLWCTYLGGRSRELIRDIAVDKSGNVLAAAIEVYRPLPDKFIVNAFDEAWAGGSEGYLAKLSADGSKLLFGTYIGGSGREVESASVCVDASDNVYYMMATQSRDVPSMKNRHNGGDDWMVFKLTEKGKAVWGTYFGGTGNEGGETHTLAVSPAGDVFIGGFTSSKDLPISREAIRAKPGTTFLARLSNSGDIEHATYLPLLDVEGMMLTKDLKLAITGHTNIKTMRPTINAVQSRYGGGPSDGVAVVLSSDFSQVKYLSYLGGSDFDTLRAVAVWNNRIIGVGEAVSRDIKTTKTYGKSWNGSSETDGIIMSTPFK